MRPRTIPCATRWWRQTGTPTSAPPSRVGGDCSSGWRALCRTWQAASISRFLFSLASPSSSCRLHRAAGGRGAGARVATHQRAASAQAAGAQPHPASAGCQLPGSRPAALKRAARIQDPSCSLSLYLPTHACPNAAHILCAAPSRQAANLSTYTAHAQPRICHSFACSHGFTPREVPGIRIEGRPGQPP